MFSSLICASLLLNPAPTGPLKSLRTRLDAICTSFHGRLGYCVKLLDSKESISNRGDERFPTASTIKTGVALEAICEIDEGKLKWTDKHPVPPMSGRQFSMWSYFFKDDTKVDVDGWTNLMLTVSDNTATMVLREWLKPDNVNARLANLGLPNTKVLWDFFPADEVEKVRLRGQFGLGVTTPKEMNRLIELIYRHKAASDAGCDKIIRILSHQYWDDYTDINAPLDVKVASKSGAIDRSRSEVALVFAEHPYILTIYTDSQKDQVWGPTNEGDVTIRKMCGLIWNALNPKRPYTPPIGFEKFMPTGGGVE
jgi:beta-lactamase class A